MGVVSLRLSRGPGRGCRSSKSSLQRGLKQLVALRAAEGTWLQKLLCEWDLPSLCFLSIPLHYFCVCPRPSRTRPKATHSFCFGKLWDAIFFSGGNQWQPSEKLWVSHYGPSRQFTFQWSLWCIAQGSRDSKSCPNTSFHTKCVRGGGKMWMGCFLWVQRPWLWSFQVKWVVCFPNVWLSFCFRRA